MRFVLVLMRTYIILYIIYLKSLRRDTVSARMTHPALLSSKPAKPGRALIRALSRARMTRLHCHLLCRPPGTCNRTDCSEPSELKHYVKKIPWK